MIQIKYTARFQSIFVAIKWIFVFVQGFVRKGTMCLQDCNKFIGKVHLPAPILMSQYHGDAGINFILKLSRVYVPAFHCATLELAGKYP